MIDRRKIRNGALIVAGLAGLAGLVFTSTRQIKPLGWYDFNGDGVEEAIVIEPSHICEDKFGRPINFDQLFAVDGNSIYSKTKPAMENGYAAMNVVGGKLQVRTDTEYICKRPLLSFFELKASLIKHESEFPVTAARVRDVDGNGKPDLELYTQLDLEPVARCDVFYNVK